MITAADLAQRLGADLGPLQASAEALACHTCGGRGATYQPSRLKVRIPAGVSDGGKIRLGGKGEPGINGGPAGDLIITGHLRPHPYLRREDDDLYLTLPITVPEAVTGGQATLGLRIPDHPVPRALARELGPIAVTSANRSGEPPAQLPEELIASVGHSLALVLDDGPVRGGVASTVVSVSREGGLEVLREGALDAPAIYTAARGD